MFGPEYNLLFFLHQLAYAGRPLLLEEVDSPSRLTAFETATVRGFIEATNRPDGSVAVTINRQGLNYLGHKAPSPQARLSNWVTSWWGNRDVA